MKSNALLWRFTFADLVLILLLVFAIIFSGIYLWGKSDKRTVYVYKNDILWGQYPVSEDRLVKVDEHNSFEIRGKKVGMVYADCADKRCVKQGFGSVLPIICLPNKLMIQVKNEDETVPHVLY